MTKSKNHIVAVHCLAGKGRTGSLINSLLFLMGKDGTVEDLNTYYKAKRAVQVDRPSQMRYMQYFRTFMKEGMECLNRNTLKINKITLISKDHQFFVDNKFKVKIYDFDNQRMKITKIKFEYLKPNEND